LVGHQVRTVSEMRWAGKSNSELIDLVSGWFDAFLGIERSIEYQQNLSESSLPIIVLSARSK